MSDVVRAYCSRLVAHGKRVSRMTPTGALHFGTWMGHAHVIVRALTLVEKL